MHFRDEFQWVIGGTGLEVVEGMRTLLAFALLVELVAMAPAFAEKFADTWESGTCTTCRGSGIRRSGTPQTIDIGAARRTSRGPRLKPGGAMRGCSATTVSTYGNGDGFKGRKTAWGKTFTATGFTSAHRSLPRGTQVRLTNVRSGKSVLVTITDRGPYYEQRIYDVSPPAMRALGGDGLACVTAEILGPAKRVAQQ